MGVWHLGNHRVEHCHLCCPFPPLSPTQRDELRQLLYQPSLPIDRSATWLVELTCRHVDTLTSGSANCIESTIRCTECAVIRGVVRAVRINSQSDDGAGASGVGCLQSEYRQLTDEQWSCIKHIVRTGEGPRRGRPGPICERSSMRLSIRSTQASRGASSQQSSVRGRRPHAGTANSSRTPSGTRSPERWRNATTPSGASLFETVRLFSQAELVLRYDRARIRPKDHSATPVEERGSGSPGATPYRAKLLMRAGSVLVLYSCQI